MNRLFIVFVFFMLVASCSGGFLSNATTHAEGVYEPTHYSFMPDRTMKENVTFSWHVGKLVTDTIWCTDEGGPQKFYLEIDGSQMPIGVPQGPFQSEFGSYNGDVIGTWGIETDYCGIQRFHKFWLAHVQSEKNPYPVGEQSIVMGKLDYNNNRLGEFMLTQCDGSPEQPIYLFVEHNTALMNRMIALDGKLVSLTVVETEGLMSRTPWGSGQKYLWVFDIRFYVDCNETFEPTPTIAPTQHLIVSQTPTPTDVTVDKMYLPFLTALFREDL